MAKVTTLLTLVEKGPFVGSAGRPNLKQLLHHHDILLEQLACEQTHPALRGLDEPPALQVLGCGVRLPLSAQSCFPRQEQFDLDWSNASSIWMCAESFVNLVLSPLSL